jgi:predicted RNA binding protein YcfA (HicA-like mRNA interferase family)
VKIPRDVDPQGLVQALGKLGYIATRQTGSHIRITTQQHGEHHEVIPNHKPLKIGTLKSILSSIAGHHKISVYDLLDLLKL